MFRYRGGGVSNVWSQILPLSQLFILRVNIAIVNEHTVCATSAFSMCMLRVVLTSFCFNFSMTLQAVESYSVCFCIIKS